MNHIRNSIGCVLVAVFLFSGDAFARGRHKQGQAPTQTNEEEPGGYGSYGNQPTEYTVLLANTSRDCTAKMSFNGQEYDIAAGATQQIQAPAGSYEVRWENADGTPGTDTLTVPDFLRVTGRCQSGPRPRPQPAVVEAPAEDEERQAQLRDGAGYKALFIYSMINIVKGSDFQPNQQQLASAMASYLNEAAQNPAMANGFIALADGSAYQTFVNGYNQADDAEKYQYARLCASSLLEQSPATWQPIPECGEGDQIDCMIADQRAKFQRGRKQAQAAEAQRLMQQTMLNGMIIQNMCGFIAAGC